jgi:hypothetical protein
MLWQRLEKMFNSLHFLLRSVAVAKVRKLSDTPKEMLVFLFGDPIFQ